MPEIKIKIDTDTKEILKLHAQDDDRSLSKYLERGLKYLADIPDGYHNHLNKKQDNIIDLSSLPEGTTIKTTTVKPGSKASLFPKRNLIKEAYDKEGIFRGRIHESDDDPFTDREYREEIDQRYPYCQSNPDFIKLKEYYDSFNSSQEEINEARERFVNLPVSYELQMHEEPYLDRAFKFTPPVDEPNLDLITYISRLAQGGWYNNSISLLTPENPAGQKHTPTNSIIG